jgi:DNA-binding transcriptional LysR family regulator
MTGTPQPAISRQITKLEAECGGRLFLRTGRGVTLSPLGERVLPRIEEILRNAQDLSHEVEEETLAASGDVRIGALPSLYLELIVPLFEELRSRFPGIRLHIFEGSAGQIDQWVATGYVDIGLPYRYGTKKTVGVERLVTVTSHLVGAAGDTLTRKKTMEFAQLDGVPLVLPSAPSGVRVVFDQLARRTGIRLNVVIEADSMQIQKTIAIRGGAYAVLPMHAYASELERGLLQASRIVEPNMDRTIAMVITSAMPATRATREVAACIRRLMQGRVAPMYEGI